MTKPPPLTRVQMVIRVHAHYIYWNNWHGRWMFTNFQRAKRFELEEAIRVAKEVGGEILPAHYMKEQGEQ